MKNGIVDIKWLNFDQGSTDPARSVGSPRVQSGTSTERMYLRKPA